MWKDEGDVRERVLLMFTKLSIEWRFMAVWGETQKDVARHRQEKKGERD